MANTNPLVQALLTDRYQLTMAYAYWKAGRHESKATFELFFRHCPFGGEFAIFAGLREALSYVEDFHFDSDDLKYLERQPGFVNCDDEFFDWLYRLDTDEVTIYAPPEGSVIFPRVPILKVEGPLAICQLLETTLLNLINFPTLVATNAARFRLAAGPDKKLSEFGLRRAQGPDGALTASRAAYIGGFDTTSNELAGKMFGIPVSGTHAHAFVQSAFPEDLQRPRLINVNGTFGSKNSHDLTKGALDALEAMRISGVCSGETNQGELAAFLDYAQAFPMSFLALIDTYDVMQSGLINFLAVSIALNKAGYMPIGVRLDSGDLSHLSLAVREVFSVMKGLFKLHYFDGLIIVASNDINEETLYSLKDQGHEIDVFGIGTHLITCQAQPALGGVYKLVALNDRPCIKLSESPDKTTIPGRKKAYRLYGADDEAILDLMTGEDETPPQVGQPILCRNPFIENKRAYVVPSRVELIHRIVWKDGEIAKSVYSSLEAARDRAIFALNINIRADHLRPLNPTRYKVSVSEQLYQYLHQLMQSEAPIRTLS